GEALTSAPCCWPSCLSSRGGAGLSAGDSGGGDDSCAGSRSSAIVAGVSGSFGFGSAAPPLSAGACLAGAGSDLAGADSDLAGADSDLARAPGSPDLGMGAPVLAGTPCPTRVRRTPSDPASGSQVALPDPRSASTP